MYGKVCDGMSDWMVYNSPVTAESESECQTKRILMGVPLTLGL